VVTLFGIQHLLEQLEPHLHTQEMVELVYGQQVLTATHLVWLLVAEVVVQDGPHTHKTSLYQDAETAAAVRAAVLI
jgi:hypothetical protein